MRLDIIIYYICYISQAEHFPTVTM